MIVHPEVPFEVVQAADDNGSTEYILAQVRAGAPGSVWAVGTEIHLVHRLAEEMAAKGVTVLSLDQLGCLCSTMFRVSPNHLLWVLEGLVDGQVHNRIVVPDAQKHWARVALDRMLADPLTRRDRTMAISSCPPCPTTPPRSSRTSTRRRCRFITASTTRPT